jgi:hypothetical protein
MTTTTDHQQLTDEQIAEIEQQIERARTEVGQIAAEGPHRRFRMSIPAQPDRDSDLIISDALDKAMAVLANLKQARRGAQELGKSVVFLAELIKDAYVRGADDPIDALHMLGNYLAEVLEDEGGLSVDEHNRVHRAMEDRRAEAERIEAERDVSERDAVAAAVRRASETTT